MDEAGRARILLSEPPQRAGRKSPDLTHRHTGAISGIAHTSTRGSGVDAPWRLLIFTAAADVRNQCDRAVAARDARCRRPPSTSSFSPDGGTGTIPYRHDAGVHVVGEERCAMGGARVPRQRPGEGSRPFTWRRTPTRCRAPAPWSSRISDCSCRSRRGRASSASPRPMNRWSRRR